jgi:hypothetical protein
MPFVDVVFGNEEDFSAALGFDIIAPLKAGNDGLVTEKARELVAIVRAARATK